jgi:hypothetical protein
MECQPDGCLSHTKVFLLIRSFLFNLIWQEAVYWLLVYIYILRYDNFHRRSTDLFQKVDF